MSIILIIVGFILPIFKILGLGVLAKLKWSIFFSLSAIGAIFLAVYSFPSSR